MYLPRHVEAGSNGFLDFAADRPFDPDQFGNWRWYWDFGGGAMTDLFVHWVDVAHWIMNADTPTRATATGLKAVLVQRQTPDTMSAALAYPGASSWWNSIARCSAISRAAA